MVTPFWIGRAYTIPLLRTPVPYRYHVYYFSMFIVHLSLRSIKYMLYTHTPCLIPVISKWRWLLYHLNEENVAQ